jgi:hypothetical protein
MKAQPERSILTLLAASCSLWILVSSEINSNMWVSVARLRAFNIAVPTVESHPIPFTFFGMHIMGVSNWPTVPFGSLGKGTGVSWPYVEPTRGKFNWSRLDSFVNAASVHKTSYMFSEAGVPSWAAADGSTCRLQSLFGRYCSSSVSAEEDWDRFVTALVTRYKGRIQVYELWNEPQNTFTGTIAELVTLTQHEHNIIRAIDPAATIISPSMISYGDAYLDKYFATGGTRDIDAVAMHGYPNPSVDVAEFISGSVTAGIKAVMNKYGLSVKPLWDTEGSWGDQSSGAIVDPELQTAFIARDYLLHWSSGISRLYWYGWDNRNIGTLWNSTRGVSAAATGYEQVYDWMNGAVMAQPCSANGASSAYHAMYTCDLIRSGGYQGRAVWNTDGVGTYTAPPQFLRYRDLAGEKHSIPSNNVVPIARKPILLESLKPMLGTAVQ